MNTMTPREGSPEHLTRPSDPIDCLLKGEELAASGNFEAADEMLTHGIRVLGDMITNDTLSPVEQEDLQNVLVCMRYTRADGLRAHAASLIETDPETAVIELHLARAELDSLRQDDGMPRFSRDTLIFISPYNVPDESTLLRNGLTYLITRAQGFIGLTAAQLAGSTEAYCRLLAIAQVSLYTADEALAGGVAHPELLALPHMPDVSQEKTAEIAEYMKEIIKANYVSRQKRRAADPALAQCIWAVTTMLDRRNETLDPDGEPLPEIRTPDLSQLGPRASKVFVLD